MLGYLFYDKKDIIRNQRFIDWLIDQASQYNLTLILKTHDLNLNELPPVDFIINRSRHAYISEHFSDIPCFNSHLVTEIANDKYKTYLYFKDHVNMLLTCPSSERKTFPCILKSKGGHGGNEVFWINKKEDMILDDTYIAQDIAHTLGKDLRVYILDNEIIASILRTNTDDFKSNYSLGGQAQLYTLKPSQKNLIHKILALLPIDYGGIDFLFDKEGHLILNEIEDAVGARMLYNLTDINIVEDFISHIASKLENY